MPVRRPVIDAQRGTLPRCGIWAMMIAIVSGVSGCAPGSAGLVSGDGLEADGARVIVVRSYGVQLRGAPTDVGLTLGYARRTYIYPETTPDLPSPGRYYFWVPQPAMAPVAWDGQAAGLDLRVASPAVGVTLGFRGSSVLAWVPTDKTVFYSLRFIPDDPASTRLRYCEGDDACSKIGSSEGED
jgi:hypothetical protein